MMRGLRTWLRLTILSREVRSLRAEVKFLETRLDRIARFVLTDQKVEEAMRQWATANGIRFPAAQCPTVKRSGNDFGAICQLERGHDGEHAYPVGR